jgi:hypothetical protein
MDGKITRTEREPMQPENPYGRALCAPKSRKLREEIDEARKVLGLPPEGLGTLKEAREWYTAHDGEDPAAIGNSPPGPVPNLRPVLDELSELMGHGFTPTAQIDEIARGITIRFGLPSSMLGWVREEILRDTSSDATPVVGTIDYVALFHKLEKPVRDGVTAAREKGNDVDGVFIHASPFHVGLQRTLTSPDQYAVSMTGLDDFTTERQWKALTSLIWSTLGNLMERPVGKRQTLESLRRNLRLWELYQDKGSYKDAADANAKDHPEEKPIDGRKVERAVKQIDQLMSPTVPESQINAAERISKKLFVNLVNGPRRYQKGGFRVVLPELADL